MVPKINLMSSSVLRLRLAVVVVVVDAGRCDCDGGGGVVDEKEGVKSSWWDWPPLDDVVDVGFGSQFLR